MLLNASVESGICARKAWGSRLQKARNVTNVCFHLLSQATLRALPDKSPSQSATQLRQKITEAVMFIKNVYETACKETWSVATPFIAPDCSDHTGFFRQESVLLLHSRTSDFSAGTLDFFQTFLQSEHQLVGLLTGTSGNFSMKAPHLISIRPMEFDHVYCTVILARGHTSDSHLAIQFVDYCQCVCVCVCVCVCHQCVGVWG